MIRTIDARLTKLEARVLPPTVPAWTPPVFPYWYWDEVVRLLQEYGYWEAVVRSLPSCPDEETVAC